MYAYIIQSMTVLSSSISLILQWTVLILNALNTGSAYPASVSAGKDGRAMTVVRADTDALRCLPDCSGHGQFDLELQKCICDEQWTGSDCSQGQLSL
ncbi:hypothetical protein CEXT_423651 [Caerostris extrusa]|uniref:EGF-like domain-containing protein n=1 Tax=Caerostris extrusa TaxID=172846 RepID=A0AAV4SXV1_CAEEX|nr:hypothetical protein CEXT_423651 [Caerostris extrusa]